MLNLILVDFSAKTANIFKSLIFSFLYRFYLLFFFKEKSDYSVLFHIPQTDYAILFKLFQLPENSGIAGKNNLISQIPSKTALHPP